MSAGKTKISFFGIDKMNSKIKVKKKFKEIPLTH